MGIEPTLSAWEAEVLPLNYARPVPKDGLLPRRACPLRDGLKQACLATGHHTEVSALSSRGNRCIPYPDHYSPAFAFSAILYPQPMHPILQPGLSRLAARLGFGLTLFRATSTSQEDPTFLPVIVLSACPHQAGRQPITYRLVRACQSIWLAHA